MGSLLTADSEKDDAQDKEHEEEKKCFQVVLNS